MKILGFEQNQIRKIVGRQDLERALSSRSPSSQMYFFTGKGTRNQTVHLGHHYVYEHLKRLSKKFDVVMQVSNDQKRNINGTQKYSKCREEFQKFKEYLRRLNPDRERFFLIENLDSDTYYLLSDIANLLSGSLKLRTVMASHGNVNVYQAYYLLLQMAPIFLMKASDQKERLCVIITAEDQKACFLLLRDLAKVMNLRPPVVLVLEPLRNLRLRDKMSSSALNSAVRLENPRNIIKGVSSPDRTPQKDFVMHLISLYSSLYPELEKIAREYRTTENTRKAKQALIKFFAELYQKMAPTSEPFSELEAVRARKSCRSQSQKICYLDALQRKAGVLSAV